MVSANMFDLEKINEWKELVVHNPQRIQEEQQVIARYGAMFHPSNLEHLTKEDFASFLLIKNNRHWDGIHRQVNMITADMPKLRTVLKELLDESRPIDERLEELFPKNADNAIKGLGRAIVTPILLMVYPDKYGVYNTKSEQGLQAMGMLPNLKRKSFAEKYVAVNGVLKQIAEQFKLSLWQVDEVIGWISAGNPPIAPLDAPEGISETHVDGEAVENYADFGLEAHLEEFLIENWERIPLGKNYKILTEDGDITGQQYITPIGRIDLLCKSCDGKEWLILELKKGRSSDAVTGQILRYISWVRANLVEEGQTVRGVIILGESDDRLMWSVKELPNVQVMTYSVSFELKEETSV